MIDKPHSTDIFISKRNACGVEQSEKYIIHEAILQYEIILLKILESHASPVYIRHTQYDTHQLFRISQKHTEHGIIWLLKCFAYLLVCMRCILFQPKGNRNNDATKKRRQKINMGIYCLCHKHTVHTHFDYVVTNFEKYDILLFISLFFKYRYWFQYVSLLLMHARKKAPASSNLTETQKTTCVASQTHNDKKKGNQSFSETIYTCKRHI